jgi:hypothetical protein
MAITYRFIRDESYWRAYFARHMYRRLWFFWPSVQIPFAIAVSLGAWFLLRDLDDPAIKFLLFGALALGAASAIAAPKLMRASMLRQVKKGPAFGGEATIVLSDKGFEGSSPLSDGSIDWEAFSGSVRHPDGILLSLTGAAVWLPDSALVGSTANAATVFVRSKTDLRDYGLPR